MIWEQKDYTVYDRWNNTADQLAEMLTFNVTGVEDCSRGSESVALGGGA